MTPSRVSYADLDTEVVLVQDVATADGAGGQTTVPVDVDTVWMSLRPVSGRELLQAGLVSAVGLYRGRMRYPEDITAAWHVRRVRDGRVFDVSAPPREIERQRWLELDLTEVR